MAKKMLINATHEEEVRVAIVEGNRLEEFDSETSTKRQIKGNVYLAKVIRIEPALQAAFVEFGGNRQGFLPFGEIHPDYFRIPVADRSVAENSPTSQAAPPALEDVGEDLLSSSEEKGDAISGAPDDFTSPLIENSGDTGIDFMDEEDLPLRPRAYHYKIQEVIKRRQIMLIQVVKEERANKGAALTTFLSLPGRYCVLMPNAGHRGGGISRKINDSNDRHRLRVLLKELEIPEGMSLIVRTAGQERNKLEIRRDFDYLIRLWEEIREGTLKATAPALIYAEGDLIKRSIRDAYTRDIDQILVEGDEAYKAAKNFMKALIPSHTKKVQPYKAVIPLFHRYDVEEQIDRMMEPTVKLPSGGSIVINSTEALVAIDVNSGRSTRERHIDETALKTNLEAADEIARQIRLRDLAGILVIDFIDMNDPKHNQAVEKRLKEATRGDRARIQISHISHFGLLEMSRQRLRPSLQETTSVSCHHCRGTGLTRSVESMSLLVLRAIESAGIQGQSAQIVATVPPGIDLYLLNQKRTSLIAMEARYQMAVMIARDDTLVSPSYRIDCLAERKVPLNFIQIDPIPEPVMEEDPEEQNEEMLPESGSEDNMPVKNLLEPKGPRRRRRRRNSKKAGENQNQASVTSPADSTTLPPLPEEAVMSAGITGHASSEAEIMPRPLTEDTSSSPAQETKEIGNSGAPHRHRRRNNQRHSSQPREKAAPETSSPVDLVTAPAKEKEPTEQEPQKSSQSARRADMPPQSKLTEVVIPIASLPVGAEGSIKKKAQRRWWKRLLET